MSMTLDVPAAVREGWGDYCASFREIVARTLPIYVIAEIASFFFDRATAGSGGKFAFFLFIMVLQALATYIVIGVFLERSTRNTEGFRWEFLPSRFGALIGAFVLISAGMALGLVFFIVPGVLFAAVTLFTMIYIVRDGRSMQQALRASITLAQPHL
ncbi:MAG: hypothetical protein KIT18_09405, partial [Burkholderiales bacterium]|nr:hypothetical protein [Burkholderiales bacterium]